MILLVKILTSIYTERVQNMPFERNIFDHKIGLKNSVRQM